MSDTVIVHETAPFADIFPTLEAAQQYIEAWDAEVVQLNRRKVVVLQEEYRRDLDSRGIIHMSGGMPRKRDDLVCYLSDSRFPYLREASEVRKWYHDRAEHAKYITMFSMQLGLISDDDLAEGLRAAHPAARARLCTALQKDDSIPGPNLLNWPFEVIGDPLAGTDDGHPAPMGVHVRCLALRSGSDGPVTCGHVVSDYAQSAFSMGLIGRMLVRHVFDPDVKHLEG